ncbi:Cell division protein FtsA [Candidatus Kinetoplastibacterium sorsogonicusi]|uniref:Cell division protein FtsA n=1 Tax=Candidatus Kinetoplastidibacterium kentomonadis TaxID=1576550 RepID=A0A3S7JAI8_9PROT|nr:cell division protein FtsA [Candidatus Kinetoplastibacterium sorsogonicusi]AWD32656.1 Cell division protein FtsA [Candidatus Kinetoplastibacterium sorsogonicusi]
MNVKHKNIVGIVDIGTTKIVVLLAMINSKKNFEIIGIGHKISSGVKKGIIVNIEVTINDVISAIHIAESMAKVKLNYIYTTITGDHINCFNSESMISVNNSEITDLDIQKVINVAKNMNIPSGQQLLNVIIKNFIIDNNNNITNPLGIISSTLGVKSHIVTSSSSVLNTLINCIYKCKVKLKDIYLHSLASSNAVLTEDDKKLGVILLDIGGGTTDIVIFYNGVVCYNKVISIAGNNITNDIATIYQISFEQAEFIKLNYKDPNKFLAIKKIIDNIEFNNITIDLLEEIIETRVQELFILIKKIILEGKYDNLISSIVITGGTAKLFGITDLAKNIFRKNIKIGIPNYNGSLSNIIRDPAFSAAIGLLRDASEQTFQENNLNILQYANINIKKFLKKIKYWFIN